MNSSMSDCDRTHTPSLEDVGAYLALYWLPTREDGRCGKPLIAISDSPVIPGTVYYFLLVKNVFCSMWLTCVPTHFEVKVQFYERNVLKK